MNSNLPFFLFLVVAYQVLPTMEGKSINKLLIFVFCKVLTLTASTKKELKLKSVERKPIVLCALSSKKQKIFF